MSKFFYNPTIGIDDSADFSMVAILVSNGDIYRKAFKIYHTRTTSSNILKCYQTPQSVLDTPRENIVKILKESSKKNYIVRFLSNAFLSYIF